MVVERILVGGRRKSGFGGLKVHVTQIDIVALKVEWVYGRHPKAPMLSAGAGYQGT